jgi:hypothetical protein
MVALASAVDASEEIWHLSAPLPGGSTYFLAQNELVRVQNRTIRLSMRDPVDTLRCRMIRGVGFTTPASHAQGVTLTPYYGEFGPAPLDTGGAGGGLPSEWSVVDDEKIAAATNVGGDGGSLEMEPGDDFDLGGYVALRGGSSEAGTGGDVEVSGGNTGATGAAEGGRIRAFGSFAGTDGGGVDVLGGVGSDSSGNTRVLAGNSNALGTAGGNATLSGGTGDTNNDAPAKIVAHGGDGAGNDGKLDVTSAGVTFTWTQAAFVADGSTVDQLRDALIAAGLMAAS